jgi:beta-lactamase superfamily II metal-dependent hydrolase
MKKLLILPLLTLALLSQAQSNHLTIYAIDVEGGQATLLVSPSKESLLVDTGWPGSNGRDAQRIQDAMKDAGITKLNHVLITHFHVDHVGGVPNLVQKVDVGEFIDHGENREDSDITRRDYAAYIKAIAGHQRRIVHPGDNINIGDVQIIVLTADGERIKTVPGITVHPNPFCASEPKAEDDPTENARSTGILVSYGYFHFLDLGDLTKAKEIALVCPNSPLPGGIDVYLVNHHGMNLSNTRALVDEIRPRVAIMDNGAHKAGSPEAWQTVHDSAHPDIYMLHTAEGSDAAHNSADALIANPKGTAQDGAYFKVIANQDGSFSVTNSRTGETKNYPKKMVLIHKTRQK